MPRDSAAADRPASYLVGTAAAFPLFFRDRAKPINQLPFSPSAKFPKSGSSCESRVNPTRNEFPQFSFALGLVKPTLGQYRLANRVEIARAAAVTYLLDGAIS